MKECEPETIAVVVKSTADEVENEDADLEALIADAVPLRQVHLSAPASLPGGYRLEVVAEGQTFFVKVPKQGVKAGEKFEATEVKVNRIMDRWADDIFDLAPNYEGGFCCLAFWCASFAFAAILEDNGRDCFGRPSKSRVAVGAVLVYVILRSCNLLPSFVVFGYFMFLATVTRGTLRRKYKIPGSWIGDCLWSTFCPCCVALQMFRHSKKSGEEPQCCKQAPLKARIV